MKIIITMLLVCSCAAQMVSRPTVSQYAPAGHRPTGEIRYLNDGSSDIITRRRDDAYKQMYEACNGRYEIVNEARTQDGQAYYAVMGSIQQWGQNYIVMRFQCL